jgi:hypothetical protein
MRISGELGGEAGEVGELLRSEKPQVIAESRLPDSKFSDWETSPTRPLRRRGLLTMGLALDLQVHKIRRSSPTGLIGYALSYEWCCGLPAVSRMDLLDFFEPFYSIMDSTRNSRGSHDLACSVR